MTTDKQMEELLLYEWRTYEPLQGYYHPPRYPKKANLEKMAAVLRELLNSLEFSSWSSKLFDLAVVKRLVGKLHSYSQKELVCRALRRKIVASISLEEARCRTERW